MMYIARLRTRDGSTQEKVMEGRYPLRYIQLPMATPPIDPTRITIDEQLTIHIRVFELEGQSAGPLEPYAHPQRMRVFSYREVANTDESSDWNPPQWWVKRYEELYGKTLDQEATLVEQDKKIDRQRKVINDIGDALNRRPK